MQELSYQNSSMTSFWEMGNILPRMVSYTFKAGGNIAFSVDLHQTWLGVQQPHEHAAQRHMLTICPLLQEQV